MRFTFGDILTLVFVALFFGYLSWVVTGQATDVHAPQTTIGDSFRYWFK